MKITPLPSVEEEGISLGDYLGCNQAELTNELRKRDDQAYTSLIEGIEGMIRPCPTNVPSQNWTEEEKINDIIEDIIENVVKPLYGKEALDKTPPNTV